MVNVSRFWARVLGLYTVIFVVGIFHEPLTYLHVIIGMIRNPAILLLLGSFTLFLGLCIIVSHSIWKGWPLLVTILGYWIALKGILILFYPAWLNKMVHLWGNHFYLSTFLSFIIGIVLLYLGFFHKK